MNQNNSYEFSIYSLQALSSFRKLIENPTKNGDRLQNVGNSDLTTKITNEVIDLTLNENVEEIANDEQHTRSNPNIATENTESTGEINNIVESILELKGNLTTDLIQQFSKCSDNDVKVVFRKVHNNEDEQIKQDMGKEIMGNNYPENIQKLYFESILIQMANGENCNELNILFIHFLETREYCSKMLAKAMLNVNLPLSIMDLVATLTSEIKQNLLTDFLNTINVVESHHIGFLLNTITNELGMDSTKIIIDVLNAASSIHATDTMYGKLIFHVVQCVGNMCKYFQSDLQKLANNHKSIWKTKIARALTTLIDNSNNSLNVTQSFMI